MFYLVVGLFFNWKNPSTPGSSVDVAIQQAGELRHRRENAHGLHENCFDLAVMRSKRLDQPACSSAWCTSEAAQSLGDFPAASVDVPVATELLLVLG